MKILNKMIFKWKLIMNKNENYFFILLNKKN